MLTPTDISTALRISRQRVHILMHEGRISGARYQSNLNRWLIDDQWKLLPKDRKKRRDTVNRLFCWGNEEVKTKIIKLWILKTKGINTDVAPLSLFSAAESYFKTNGMTVADYKTVAPKDPL